MKNRKITRILPLCIERLAKEGYIVNIDSQKKQLQITYNLSRYLTIPFGQTRLTEFGG